MTGERQGLVADPLHQAAVAAEDVGVMIDDGLAELGCEQTLGQRHPDRVAEPLPERAGGDLDPARMAALGMAGGAAAELPETLKLGHRHVRIAEEMQEAVEQHRAVPVRQHEAVAVGPVRRMRVETQVFGEQHGGDVGHAHRHAGMPGFGLFDRVHGERAQRIGHMAELRVARRGEGRGNIVHMFKIAARPIRARAANPLSRTGSTTAAWAVRT